MEEKMMRISLAAKKLNVGLATIFEILARKGYKIENNPHAKLNFEHLMELEKHFKTSVLIEDNVYLVEKHREILNRINECKISKSEFLDLSGLELTSIPIELKELNHLKSLSLKNNRLNSLKFSKIARTNGDILYFRESTEININNRNSQKGVSDPFESLIKLQFLDISSNKISDLYGIDSLKSLIILLANNNQIIDIDVLSNLKELAELDLSNNKLNSIKPIFSLSKLTNLRINEVGILSEFPESLLVQPKLLSLSATNNFIFNITPIVAKFPNLKILDLASNLIVDATEVQKLRNLCEFNISFNKLKDLNFLSKLTNLEKLYLNSNEIEIENFELKNIIRKLKKLNTISLPIGIAGIPEGIENDMVALRQYLKDIDTVVKNNTIKVVLIGNTFVGKSSFVDLWKDNKIKNDRISTHGVRIINWKNCYIDTKNFEVNFFDFGGQDYYHAIHNLYLSHNALYILLWQDISDDSLVKDMPLNQRLKEGYWLGNIDYVLSNTKREDDNINVLLVQNKADGEKGILQLDQQLIKLYNLPNEPQFHISLIGAKENKPKWTSYWNFFEDNLKRKITEVCQNTNLTSDMVSIRDEVLPEVQTKIICKIFEFVSECNRILEFNRSEEELLPTFLYLRAAGYILWYREVDTLKDWLVTDPTKLSNEFLTILENKTLSDKQGILKSNSFKVKGIDNNILIEILKEHKIIFENPKTKDEFIVPQYLPEQKLEKHLLSIIPPSFVLRFEHYMPFWKISHFIIEKGKEIENQSEFWRYGIIYKENGATILVRVQRPEILEGVTDQKVYIHILNDNQKDKIQIINEIIDYFATYPKKKRLVAKDNSITKQAGQSTQFTLPKPEYIERDKRDGFEKFSKRDFIKKVQLSVDDIDFFEIEDMFDDDVQKSRVAKTIKGKIRHIPSLFFPVLGIENVVPKRIFISYSHADEIYLREFENHLSALKRNGLVEVWHDQKIILGEDWDKKIMDSIDYADIVLGFISSDFMASRYIWEKEIPEFNRKNKIFVPIFIRPCDIDNVWFLKNQGAPFFDSAYGIHQGGINWVVNYAVRDNAYYEIVKHLKDIILEREYIENDY